MTDADAALRAIRQKFATTADVARRLGFNDQWEDIEHNGGGRDMRSAGSGAPTRDQPPAFPGVPRPGQGPSDQLSYGASEGYDDRDAEAPGDPIHYFTEGGAEAWGEFRKDEPAAYDAMVRWARGKRAASDRRLNAHDHAIALRRARDAGQAGDVDVLNAMRPRRSLAEDRARAAGAVSFTQMFPGAARIRHSF